MGKDQELLEASRCGNTSVVEKILNQRAKKTGPLASLRRGPGPNVQDNSGFTPLHHACLNGHIEIVTLLLNHEASCNIVDNKGCTPLHLTAWSGNTEIVKLLLTQGPSFPSVNHMNFDHESALHSAAQYGHTAIVQLLLEHNCYPSVRNVRNESPLDLASQYGRLETVQCLLNAHPGLLSDIVRCHSPLHLAAKNGHKSVVQLLLDAGFDVNYMTDIGTALHEAAMYGKAEIAKVLLDYGIDANLENSRKRTVFDILNDLNTGIANQIEDSIKDHMTLIKLDSESNESLSAILPPHGFVAGSYLEAMLPERCSLSGITPPRQFCSPSLDESFYEILPPHKLRNQSPMRGNNSLSSLTPSQSQDSCFDQTSLSSCSPSKCDPLETSVYENTLFQNVDSDSLLYEIPPPPTCFSTKRFSDPLQQCSIYQNVTLVNTSEEKAVNMPFDSCTITTSWTLPGSYLPMLPAPSNSNRPLPPAKPPRKSVSPHPTDSKNSSFASQSRSEKKNYEFLCLATSGLHHRTSKSINKNKHMDLEDLNYVKPHYASEYVDMSLKNRTIPAYENHEIICANGLDFDKSSCSKEGEITQRASPNKFSEVPPFSTLCDDVHRKVSSFNNLMPSKSTPALHASRHMLDQAIPAPGKELEYLKPNYLNFKQKRITVQIPTSPTSYQQPPTPDIPPPSPATAELGIHKKIHPAGLKCKRDLPSRDIDTLTDEQLVATIGPHGEVELILATDNKCVSTENESLNPFAGLCRGSISPLSRDKTELQFQPTLKGPSSKYSLCKFGNIYENVQIAMEEDHNNRILSSSDCSPIQNNLSVMSPFDEKAEWAEIADIMASFGGSITRESVFAQNVESSFAQAFRSDSPRHKDLCYFSSITQWLLYLGLTQYENILVINGFDDVNFLGGKLLEEADLEEIGIHNAEHRQKLCMAAKGLPPVQSISKLKRTLKFPKSIDEWLQSINLQEYSEIFVNNNITDMDRALKLWEVELNTVLKITKLGHRKRILVSLGDKHVDNIVNSEDLDLSKLNLDLSGLEIPENKNSKFQLEKPEYDDSLSNSRKHSLTIRSPSQLMKESNDSNKLSQQNLIEAQWRHHPDELVINSCNYMAKYLGSTLVKELQGLESTKKSIQKLKASTKDIAKIPNIILSISYSGVKFIDAETQQLVCEHEIRNIHCACQDADDLCHFAYITKEHQTHNHYCHVFSSHTVDLASEIILTLGQAFEVAYQIALKEKAERVHANHAWRTSPSGVYIEPRNSISTKGGSS